MAPQLTEMNGPSRLGEPRRMALAITSFPTPVSPEPAGLAKGNGERFLEQTEQANVAGRARKNSFSSINGSTLECRMRQFESTLPNTRTENTANNKDVYREVCKAM